MYSAERTSLILERIRRTEARDRRLRALADPLFNSWFSRFWGPDLSPAEIEQDIAERAEWNRLMDQVRALYFTGFRYVRLLHRSTASRARPRLAA